MAIRDVVVGEDNEDLRQVSREVKQITPHILTLLDDMRETLIIEDGGGLAAPQVGVKRRIAVVSYDGAYYELINPKILSEAGETVEEEGCLSLPDVWAPVARPETVTVGYTDRDGQTREIEASGLLARVFCHEIDHLDGVLFVDKMLEEDE